MIPLTDELTDRAACRAKLRAFFLAHPGEVFDQATLQRAGAGDAVSQRVSECRAAGMTIESVPTIWRDADGKAHRGKHRYRYVPTPESTTVGQGELFT